MANPDRNLVLEHLRHIRGRVDQIGEDVHDLKQRMNALERGQARMLGHSAELYGDQVTQQSSIDRIRDRLDRIERRLELVDE